MWGPWQRSSMLYRRATQIILNVDRSQVKEQPITSLEGKECFNCLLSWEQSWVPRLPQSSPTCLKGLWQLLSLMPVWIKEEEKGEIEEVGRTERGEQQLGGTHFLTFSWPNGNMDVSPGCRIWNDDTVKYSLKKTQWGRGSFGKTKQNKNFHRQYLSLESFHLQLCPFSKGGGEGVGGGSQTVNHSLIWSTGWVFYQHLSDAHSHWNPRTFTAPLNLWVRGRISTFCSVFGRVRTGRDKRGCFCWNRSPDEVMSCNNGVCMCVYVGGGLEMAVHKDKQKEHKCTLHRC